MVLLRLPATATVVMPTAATGAPSAGPRFSRVSAGVVLRGGGIVVRYGEAGHSCPDVGGPMCGWFA